ncbi:ArsR/SmtB family transcription factor [Pseudonocardia sichuanensis]
MTIDCCGQDLSPAVALFRSLADPTRLAIVQRLAQGEARVVDLTRTLGLAQSTVSKHLACLRDCRLIDYRSEGRQSFYSLTRPELIDLLRSAEMLLAQTGEAVALCPVYGRPGAEPDELAVDPAGSATAAEAVS